MFISDLAIQTDYSPLAIAAGVQHYMVHETEYVLPTKFMFLLNDY